MNLFTFITSSLTAEQAVVLVTLIQRSGSSSRKHARFAIREDGTFRGTIGGGKAERDIIALAHDCFTSRKSCFTTYGKNLYYFDYLDEEFIIPLYRKAARLADKDIPFAIASFTTTKTKALLGENDFLFLAPSGEKSETLVQAKLQQCFSSGTLSFSDDSLFDYVGHKGTIVLFGSGHVSEAIASLAHFIGRRVMLLETNAQYASKADFPHVASIAVCASWKEGAASLTLTADDQVVITKDSFDEAALELLLSGPVGYIGILCSRQKAHRWHDERIHAPIGLDIGGESPEETALSIISEIAMVSAGRKGGSLSSKRELIIVRGAGDLATGTIIRLHNAGYLVMALEIAEPTVIRRTVSFAEAMFQGSCTVEGVTAQRIGASDEAYPLMDSGIVPILADPEGKAITTLHPDVVIDAILAKRNLGTKITDAPLVIALGPGFTAGGDCHVVIETKRGHNLGKIIHEGQAIANTGIPGIIGGYGIERVVHSPDAGLFTHVGKEIGDLVEAGDVIAKVGETPVTVEIAGMLRGLLRDGLTVPKGFKVADVDPRGKEAQYLTCSDKAKAIAGGVLEAVDSYLR